MAASSSTDKLRNLLDYSTESSSSSSTSSTPTTAFSTSLSSSSSLNISTLLSAPTAGTPTNGIQFICYDQKTFKLRFELYSTKLVKIIRSEMAELKPFIQSSQGKYVIELDLSTAKNSPYPTVYFLLFAIRKKDRKKPDFSSQLNKKMWRAFLEAILKNYNDREKEYFYNLIDAKALIHLQAAIHQYSIESREVANCTIDSGPFEGFTLISIAILFGNVSLLKTLLTKHFVDPFQKISEEAELFSGFSLLHLAANPVFDNSKIQIAIFENLFQAQEALNFIGEKKEDGLLSRVKTDYDKNDNPWGGHTPLHIAIGSTSSSPEVIEYLIEKHKKTAKEPLPLLIPITDEEKEEEQEKYENKPILFYAIEAGCHADAFKLLFNYFLTKGENPLTQIYHGHTLLSYSCSIAGSNAEILYLNIVKFLVEEHKADPFLPVLEGDYRGNNALHIAIKQETTNIVKFFVKKASLEALQLSIGEEYDDILDEGITPLYLAAGSNFLIFQILATRLKKLNEHFDLNQPLTSGDCKGLRTLNKAAGVFGNLEIVKYLIEDCQVDVRQESKIPYDDDKDSYPVLTSASESGDFELFCFIAKALEEKGVSLREEAYHKKKAATFEIISDYAQVSVEGREEMLRYLVEEKKIDVFEMNKHTQTSGFGEALRWKATNIIAYFLKQRRSGDLCKLPFMSLRVPAPYDKVFPVDKLINDLNQKKADISILECIMCTLKFPPANYRYCYLNQVNKVKIIEWIIQAEPTLQIQYFAKYITGENASEYGFSVENLYTEEEREFDARILSQLRLLKNLSKNNIKLLEGFTEITIRDKISESTPITNVPAYIAEKLDILLSESDPPQFNPAIYAEIQAIRNSLPEIENVFTPIIEEKKTEKVVSSAAVDNMSSLDEMESLTCLPITSGENRKRKMLMFSERKIPDEGRRIAVLLTDLNKYALATIENQCKFSSVKVSISSNRLLESYQMSTLEYATIQYGKGGNLKPAKLNKLVR